MLGVYLTAAELTHKGLIVSITSRNAKGADLLATDQAYKNTWSIQVKTNSKPASFWLLNKSYKDDVAKRHIYVFVNLRGDLRPDYYIVPSLYVAKLGYTTPKRKGGSIWHAFYRNDAARFHERWSTFSGPVER